MLHVPLSNNVLAGGEGFYERQQEGGVGCCRGEIPFAMLLLKKERSEMVLWYEARRMDLGL